MFLDVFVVFRIANWFLLGRTGEPSFSDLTARLVVQNVRALSRQWKVVIRPTLLAALASLVDSIGMVHEIEAIPGLYYTTGLNVVSLSRSMYYSSIQYFPAKPRPSFKYRLFMCFTSFCW